MYNAFISYAHTADDKFAPALQRALQQFAKPWYKKRHLEIFRDESSLSASPHLWKNITKALDESEYLVVLASPGSEKSKWVNKEVEYFLEKKSINNILLALTDGRLEWDDGKNCFLYPDCNSLPPALDNKFDSEPFYIDLRQSRNEADLSLNNPIFKKEVLKLAAKLHGKPPNDLASEEVTVHRKMMLVRNSAISLLIVLLMGALIAGFIANENRKEAEKQSNIADKNLKDFQELKKTSIGAKFQGGVVFKWNDSTGKHGLVAAAKDLPGTYVWQKAVDTSTHLSINGYSDWYLPTKEELSALYTNRFVVGGFDSSYYWSRTIYKGDNTNAVFQSFVHGDQVNTSRSRRLRVRVVRAY